MNNKPELFDLENLAFFGRVNASISHELKNIMAIISETAGLLTDLSEMAKKGSPIELDMLLESTHSIVEEIQRGFKTIRQMNRFSHSIDVPVCAIDLREILNLVSHLTGYLAFTGEICIHPVDGRVPEVLTCPFILQTVIYESVVRIFREGGPETKLDMHIVPDGESAWKVIFKSFSLKTMAGFPDDSIKCPAASIGVSIHCDPETDCLEIEVPVSTPAVEAFSEPAGSPLKEQ